MSNDEISVAEWAQKDGKKQEAIKFKIWCDENEDAINFREEQTHTTEHLYDIFKKENP